MESTRDCGRGAGHQQVDTSSMRKDHGRIDSVCHQEALQRLKGALKEVIKLA